MIGRVVAITDAGTRFVVRLRQGGNVLVGLSDGIRRGHVLVQMGDHVDVNRLGAEDVISWRFPEEPAAEPSAPVTTREALIKAGLIRPASAPTHAEMTPVTPRVDGVLCLDRAGVQASKRHMGDGPIREPRPDRAEPRRADGKPGWLEKR